MKTQKLISVRVDPDALNVIDLHCEGISYRTRSFYIDAAVRFMAWLIANGKADSVARFRADFGDVVDEFEFQYHRGHK